MKYPPFLSSQSAQPLLNSVPFFFCDCSKFGHKVIKIDKFIGICMENGLKMFKNVDNFFIFTPIVLQVHSRQVHRSRHKIYQFQRVLYLQLTEPFFNLRLPSKYLCGKSVSTPMKMNCVTIQGDQSKNEIVISYQILNFFHFLCYLTLYEPFLVLK